MRCALIFYCCTTHHHEISHVLLTVSVHQESRYGSPEFSSESHKAEIQVPAGLHFHLKSPQVVSRITFLAANGIHDNLLLKASNRDGESMLLEFCDFRECLKSSKKSFQGMTKSGTPRIISTLMKSESTS